MSHTAFDFLSDSLLFDQEHIATKYADVSDAELWTELEKYREHRARARGGPSRGDRRY